MDLELNENLDKLNLENGKEKSDSVLKNIISKGVNIGIDMALRALLPNVIEDQVIKIKDSILENGFEKGLKTAIDESINLGKSVLGIFTGNFENIGQVQNVIKTGGLIDSVSALFDFALKKVNSSGKLDNTTYNLISKGKNIILDSVESKIENQFLGQLDSLEKLDKYKNNWKNYYNDKDFEGMEKEYKKIKEKERDIIPIESTIREIKNLENIHTLIKNNGIDFNLSEQDIKLAEQLI